MYTLCVKDKEYKIRFGYEPTLKSKIISKVGKCEALISRSDADSQLESLEELLLFIPEFLLVAMQAENKEFRYDWDTGEGKEEQLAKMYELIDDYCNDDDSDSDALELYHMLTDQMLKNGFLKSMYRQEVAKAVQESKKKSKVTKIDQEKNEN